LEEKVNNPLFWNDQSVANEVLDKQNSIKKVVEKIDFLTNSIKDKKSDLELLEMENDIELHTLLENEINLLEDEINKFEMITLLDGEYDKNNCILEIHSGAGGTESCDWVNILYRLYTRYCEKHGYKYEVIDSQPGEEVGLKSISMLIKGEYAYGYLKCEKGVHRLIRLSPFDSNNRRHTTFASINIIPEFDSKINIDIKEEDIKIDVYRSSGAGGQSVNTTDSAVRITHIPTKTVVTCQNERSQLKNKEKALQILKNKLYLLELEIKEQELSKIKGINVGIDFGSQIRSYIMHPYSLVKDHRTNTETSNVNSVIDGNIDMFIEAYLREVVE